MESEWARARDRYHNVGASFHECFGNTGQPLMIVYCEYVSGVSVESQEVFAAPGVWRVEVHEVAGTNMRGGVFEILGP